MHHYFPKMTNLFVNKRCEDIYCVDGYLIQFLARVDCGPTKYVLNILLDWSVFEVTLKVKQGPA